MEKLHSAITFFHIFIYPVYILTITGKCTEILIRLFNYIKSTASDNAGIELVNEL